VKGPTRLGDADAQALIATFKAAYPGKDNMYLAQLLISQWSFNDGVINQAEKKAQQAAAGGAPDYFFYFAHHTDVRGGVMHAPHTSEIPYVYDSLAHSAPIVGTITPAKQKLADMCSSYWANFAKTGNPNGPNLPRWEPFTLQTRAMLVVTDQGTKMENDPLKATRAAIVAAKAKVSPGGAFG
jgi:para-nitrobenzyl esterase